MYSLGMRNAFVARHYLVGGDWGAENIEHSHYYEVEVELRGDGLDEHGYVVDFVDVEGHLADVVSHYRDALLNELPEFSGLNPSVEHLSRLFCQTLWSRIIKPRITAIKVKIWEKQGVWAAYEEERQ